MEIKVPTEPDGALGERIVCERRGRDSPRQEKKGERVQESHSLEAQVAQLDIEGVQRAETGNGLPALVSTLKIELL